MRLRVFFIIKTRRTSLLKQFEGTIKDSMDSNLVEEVKAREELNGGNSRGFSDEFDIQVRIHIKIVRNSYIPLRSL